MKRCLIVVDFQNDFVTGSLGFPEAEKLIPAIIQKIESCRTSGDVVLFTFDTHETSYLDTQEGTLLPVEHCIRGTDGHRLHPEIEKLRQPDDLCFKKTTFGSAELMDYLRAHRFESIELCGLVSNICVLSNAVLAKTAQPETPILIDVRCTAGADPALHKAALQVMQGLQMQLIGIEEDTE
ncbi:MAG: cysteine hydrolase [Ruminococcus sp.]|nr:cysteine hydrolase [Ruminococcus sp.]